MLLVAGAHILHYKDETGLHFLIANFVVGSSAAAAAFSEPSPSAIAFSFKEETL